jgi:hypothetical protein
MVKKVLKMWTMVEMAMTAKMRYLCQVRTVMRRKNSPSESLMNMVASKYDARETITH